MPGFDLRSYLDRFPEVCRAKFRRSYSFRALEKEFEPLRSGKRWLAARDVLKLFDPTKTPFERYWSKPNEKELNQLLSQQRVLLAPLPADSRSLIERLLAVFHNIGVTSLLLRFVHPECFGIFSTPLVYLLQVHRPTTVELYMAFSDELREWQKHFRMDTVAETETALWTFHELTYGAPASADADQARLEFDSDVWIQRRRVSQALKPFFDKYGALELARIFAEEHPKLAGKIAGEEYERLLRYAARHLGGGLRLNVKGATTILFNRLLEAGHISLGDRALLDKAWKVRCDAVHPEGQVKLEEVENMIDTLERLCRPWES